MGTDQYARRMTIGFRAETDDERHHRLLGALTARLAQLRAADATSPESRPPLLPEEQADEATQEILDDPETVIGLIESIEDAMAGREVSLAEFRTHQRRAGGRDDAVTG